MCIHHIIFVTATDEDCPKTVGTFGKKNKSNIYYATAGLGLLLEEIPNKHGWTPKASLVTR